MEKCELFGTISFIYSFNIYLSFYSGSYEFLTYLNLDVLSNKYILQVATEIMILGVRWTFTYVDYMHYESVTHL